MAEFNAYDPATIDREIVGDLLYNKIHEGYRIGGDRARSDAARAFFGQLVDYIMQGEFFQYDSENNWTIQDEIEAFMERLNDDGWHAEILIPTVYPGVPNVIVENIEFTNAFAALTHAKKTIEKANSSTPSPQAWFQVTHEDDGYEVFELAFSSQHQSYNPF